MAIEDSGSLLVEIRNERPIELRDLTLSLLALGQSYEDYVISAGYDLTPGNVRLYVRELRSGSTIADLVGYADQIHAFVDMVDTLAGFVASTNDLLQFFLGFQKLTHLPSKKEAERLNQVLEPIAKDNGAQLILQVNGDVKIDQSVKINYQQANAAQNQITRYLSGKVPKNSIHRDQLLYLRQVRDDVSGSVGDRGVIDRLSSRQVKLQFASESAKKTILDQAYPIRVAFVVDVDVNTVEDEPALYRVLDVKDVISRPDADDDVSTKHA